MQLQSLSQHMHTATHERSFLSKPYNKYLIQQTVDLQTAAEPIQVYVEKLTRGFNEHFISMSIFPPSVDSAKELPRASTVPITIKQTAAHQ